MWGNSERPAFDSTVLSEYKDIQAVQQYEEFPGTGVVIVICLIATSTHVDPPWDSPSSSEGRMPERLDQTENTMQAGIWKDTRMPMRYGERVLAARSGMSRAAKAQGRG